MKKKVLVCFIQDRSGSMGTCWAETLNGFRTFVKDLKEGNKEDDVDYLFSLTTFDTQIETPIIGKAITEVDEDSLAKFGPRAATALYDAVGITIDNTDKDRHGADKIICVIVTDGQENSSREWSKEALHSVIDKHLNAGDWTFTYLGTQPETWSDATSIGVGVGATAGYSGLRAGDTYAVTSDALRSFSRSNEKQVKNLFTSRHLSSPRASAAGMTVKPETAPPQLPPPVPVKPPVTSKVDSRRRWK